ncbi:N-acetyltransferase [Opitutaceae bacterium TAV4]|uniref:N-acetyltransferase n=1 Tax=Geminisphaera colitermitum TaxID=1148786 RepID=UPI0005BA25C5|nr:N-acetyltransferase [Geminisphaera colitermitum]RRJ95903.1 N-acetyltransferase [Opitutaceae bacterium TAV4]RRK00056.1 N-acetyltransferase [Opitutaceae bacterium TAV3]
MVDENDSSIPYLHSYASGDTVWITRFFIPPTLRGQHLGRMIVEKWEKSLPAHIRVIRLRAPDTDSARPCLFWSKLGFRYTQSDETPIYSEFEITRHTEMEKVLAEPVEAQAS